MEQFRTNNEILTVERKSRLKREYEISDDKEKVVSIVFSGNPEGTIVTENGEYEVHSSGRLGKSWTLNGKDGVKAEAQRRGLRSAIVIEVDEKEIHLSRKHLLSGEFELTSEDTVIALIGKPKLISGASEIHVFHGDLDLLVYAFVFWICEHVREHTTDAWS